MGELSPPSPTLDELSASAVAGDAQAEATLFGSLGVRFLTIAKRRVQEADVQDVVQDALRIVLTKYGGRGAHEGILIWSLAVLRNVIGNYYQARKREGQWVSHQEGSEGLADVAAHRPHADATGTGGFDVDSGAAERIIAAISALSRTHPRCASIFRAILESTDQGGGAREVSLRAMETVRHIHPEITRGAFYVALHRCRSRLREIVEEMERSPGP